MNTYEVQGSIALNFSVRVEAASEDEAVKTKQRFMLKKDLYSMIVLWMKHQ